MHFIYEVNQTYQGYEMSSRVSINKRKKNKIEIKKIARNYFHL